MNDADLQWQKEKYRAMLDACAHAIHRARYVFLAVNIGGVAILAGLFNGTIPWLRNAIDRAKQMSSAPPHLPYIQKTMYEDLWTISLPLLGIKFSVFDISIIGSTGLLVLALWLFYCVRRENQVVSIVVKEAEKVAAISKECASYLYHGIAHYFVFTTKLERNAPAGIDSLAEPTIALKILLFMPAWVPAVAIITDTLTLFVPHSLSFDPSAALWSHLSPLERFEAVIRLLWAALATFFSFCLCTQIVRCDKGTRNLIDSLKQQVD